MIRSDFGIENAAERLEPSLHNEMPFPYSGACVEVRKEGQFALRWLGVGISGIS